MRILIYKRTHSGDPDPAGCFGAYDCMGKVRDRAYDAVVRVGGIGAEARSNGIDGRVNWIGIGPHKRYVKYKRGPEVLFDHFLNFGTGGPYLRDLAPCLAKRIYGKNVRSLLDGRVMSSERKPRTSYCSPRENLHHLDLGSARRCRLRAVDIELGVVGKDVNDLANTVSLVASYQAGFAEYRPQSPPRGEEVAPNGLLYRVGIDSTAGGWNAPCRDEGTFCYVPIPARGPGGRGSAFDHTYEEFLPFVKHIGGAWPARLRGICHLDPDFVHLTYGDANTRSQRIREFISPGSFIAFWAALRLLDGPRQGELVCSLIGFFRVSHVLWAADIGTLDTHRNAHTRVAHPGNTDVVVYADPRESGRLRRHIPIGEYQRGAQRVRATVLEEWGGLRTKVGESLRDGYIQRSGNPPIFANPNRFLKWFRKNGPELVHANNV